jgi:hypothetical protein
MISNMNVNDSTGQKAYPPGEGPIDKSTPINQIESSKEGPYAQYFSSAYPPQNFNQGYVDDAKSDKPQLPSPIVGKEKRGAEEAIQDIVRGIIAKEITVLLPKLDSPDDVDAIYANLLQGRELKNPKLQEIADPIRLAVESKVKREARLENFTLEALYIPNEQAWIQSPLAPFGKEKKAEVLEFYSQSLQKNLGNFLNKATPQDPALMVEFVVMKDRLTLAVAGGHVHPTIKAALAEIKNISLEETRQKFGLLISWNPETKETENWKPVNQGIVSVDAIGAARQERVNQNINLILKNMSQAVETLLKKIPENDPKKSEIQNFLSTILDAIYNYQKELQEYQLILAQQSEEHTLTTLSIQNSRNNLNILKKDEAKETQKKQKMMETFGDIMKWVGPAVAVLALAISIATLPVGGPVAIAGVVIAVAALAYSVLESTTGVTSLMMEGFNDLINMLPTTDFGKAMAKALVVVGGVVLIAILAAAIVSGSGAGAAANVAVQTVGTVAKQVVAMTAKQVAIQASMILVMGSGVLLEIPTEALKLTNLDDTSIEVLKYTIMALEMMAVLAISIGMSSSAMKIQGTPEQAAQAAVSASKSVSEKVTEGAKVIKKEISDAVETSINEFIELVKSFSTRIKNIDTIPRESKEWLISILKAIPNQFLDTIKDAQARGVSPVKEILLLLANRIGPLLPAITNSVSSAMMAVGYFQLYNLLREAADTEKMLAAIQAMLDLLSQVVRNLQSAIQGNTEDFTIFSELFDKILNSISQASRNLAQFRSV